MHATISAVQAWCLIDSEISKNLKEEYTKIFYSLAVYILLWMGVIYLKK
jgi:hypothetical protein